MVHRIARAIISVLSNPRHSSDDVRMTHQFSGTSSKHLPNLSAQEGREETEQRPDADTVTLLLNFIITLTQVV
jgi:hypothetical protein